jgi:hypothetical protein
VYTWALVALRLGISTPCQCPVGPFSSLLACDCLSLPVVHGSSEWDAHIEQEKPILSYLQDPKGLANDKLRLYIIYFLTRENVPGILSSFLFFSLSAYVETSLAIDSQCLCVLSDCLLRHRVRAARVRSGTSCAWVRHLVHVLPEAVCSNAMLPIANQAERARPVVRAWHRCDGRA